MSPSSATGNPIEEDPVHRFIGNLIASVLHDLMEPDARPSITIKRRFQRGRAFRIVPHDGEERTGGGVLEVDTTEPDIYTTYSWPGKTAYEAWKFSMDS